MHSLQVPINPSGALVDVLASPQPTFKNCGGAANPFLRRPRPAP
jgi:hypothetical protein